MIALHHLRALEGACRLALFDASGAEYFQTSPSEARRSFIAPLLALPLFLLMQLTVPDWRAQAGQLWLLLPFFALVYMVNLTGFFCITDLLMRLAGRFRRLPAFITAYNWSLVIQMAVLAPLILMNNFGIAPDMVMKPLVFIATTGILCYQWFLAKKTLRISGFLAVSLVMADMMISIMMNMFVMSGFPG